MKLKKMDIILVLTIVLISVAGLIVYNILGQKDAGTVMVEVEGNVFGEYALNENREVMIYESNVLIIEDGVANMLEADCPDQICVDHIPISKNGETIVCLPNKVVVTITEGKANELDAVVQ